MEQSEQTPQKIRQDIEETRAALVDKIESLEFKVRSQVEDARDTVHDTVEKVKNTFSLTHQVQQRPWAVLGGALVAGVVLRGLTGGRLTESGAPDSIQTLKGGREDFTSPAAPWSSTLSGSVAGSSTAESSFRGGPAPKVSSLNSPDSMIGRLVSEFSDEINEAKGIAIGAGMGLLTELLRNSVPEAIAPHFNELVERTTRKMGGKPIEGNIIKKPASGSFR